MLHANNITHLHKITGGPPALSGREAKPKLLDQLREALRSRHYSRRTEQTYCHWVKRFIYFHNVRHPCEMAEPEINAFLTHLAVKEKVSASTQNQALSALLFLYRHVIGRGIGDLGEVIRARKPTRLPVVMTPTLRRNGAGNGSSPRKTAGRAPRPTRKGGIMWMSRWFKKGRRSQRILREGF
jgi:hypothetical protein